MIMCLTIIMCFDNYYVLISYLTIVMCSVSLFSPLLSSPLLSSLSFLALELFVPTAFFGPCRGHCPLKIGCCCFNTSFKWTETPAKTAATSTKQYVTPQ